jgi:hypothetical protein
MQIKQRTLASITAFFDSVPLRFTLLRMLSIYSLSNLAWKNLKYFGSWTIFKPHVDSR